MTIPCHPKPEGGKWGSLVLEQMPDLRSPDEMGFFTLEPLKPGEKHPKP